jgi:hypothetical protein
MPVLKTTPHLHLDFMHERLAIVNLDLDLPRFAEQRAEFSRPLTDKGRLIFALKTVPAEARPLQPRHRFRTIGRGALAQRPLIDQDNMAATPIAS